MPLFAAFVPADPSPQTRIRTSGRETNAPGTTWWIYALIGLLAVFAVSTIFCTVDALLEGATWRSIALKLSPQVMHAGVLFIMLGHLLTATLGEKIDIDVRKGETAPVGSAASIMLMDVRETTDENGYAVDWEATLRWVENGRPSAPHRLRPARPLYFGSYGLYTKAIDAGSPASAWIRVSRDPGAPWALLGGILHQAVAAAEDDVANRVAELGADLGQDRLPPAVLGGVCLLHVRRLFDFHVLEL